MEKTRQQILILHLVNPELHSKTVAWALYDSSVSEEEEKLARPSASSKPPYQSVMEAMRDGWNVIQLATLTPILPHGHEHETGILPFEYVMERKVATNG